MIKNKKAQMDPRELVLTLVIVGATAIVGLLVFANVANTSDSLFDPDTVIETNESITISSLLAGSDNSTLLSKVGYVIDSEVVRNATAPFTQLTRGTDYSISTTFGALDQRGNFTLLSVDETEFNNTALFITYDFLQSSAAQNSVAVVETTVLDSFALGVIALIVLAAVVILSILFRLGT